MTEALESLNAMLAGSPYLLDNSASGQNRAKFLLEESALIEERERAVEAHFQRRSEEIRRGLDLITEARTVFESNALELTGLPLSETEAEIENAPDDLDALREYVAQRAVKGNRHLLDVLGLHQANQFARMLARSSLNRRGRSVRSTSAPCIRSQCHPRTLPADTEVRA